MPRLLLINNAGSVGRPLQAVASPSCLTFSLLQAQSARGKVYGGMLRVVNVHDIVPDLPSALRLPFYR